MPWEKIYKVSIATELSTLHGAGPSTLAVYLRNVSVGTVKSMEVLVFRDEKAGMLDGQLPDALVGHTAPCQRPHVEGDGEVDRHHAGGASASCSSKRRRIVNSCGGQAHRP
jgi:hypothetical protein